MKLKKIAVFAILSAMLLTGCEVDSEVSTSETDSAVKIESNETADEKAENQEQISEEKENESSEESETESELAEEEINEPAEENSKSDSEDIMQIASVLYDKSCETQWTMILSCPYNLDYNVTESSGAVMISDSSVGSLDDIEAEYCEVFENAGQELFDKYFELNGEIYCYDGARGMNIKYQNTTLSLVSENEDEAVFSAVSHYADPETGEELEDKTDDFVIIKTEKGWRTRNFTLPY